MRNSFAAALATLAVGGAIAIAPSAAAPNPHQEQRQPGTVAIERSLPAAPTPAAVIRMGTVGGILNNLPRGRHLGERQRVALYRSRGGGKRRG